ncbi:MAG: J domain-containing protein [Desulfovermiculus sp.]|nr:J domain-containing protein [Desulfovermiculus sp.]
MLEKDGSMLRVPRDADLEVVRKAFVKLSRRYPPEHFPDKFKEIKRAYDRLTLNYSSINSLVKELASAPTAQAMAKCLVDEALQDKTNSPPPQVPELNVYSLEPIFDAPAQQQRLKKLLQDIGDQGLEYKEV